MCRFLILMKPKDDVKGRLHLEMMSVFTQDLFFHYRRTSKEKKASISFLTKQQLHIAPVMIEVNVSLEAWNLKV